MGGIIPVCSLSPQAGHSEQSRATSAATFPVPDRGSVKFITDGTKLEPGACANCGHVEFVVPGIG